MDLRHYAENAVELDRTRVYDRFESTTDYPYRKPKGLWISDESDYGWAKWCADEDFNPDRLSHCHEVTLGIGTQPLLLLSTEEQVRTFDARFGYSGRWGRGIRWEQVADVLAGIFITPYRWELRLDLDWYYGWDVASGCVWNLSVIHDWKPMERKALS